MFVKEEERDYDNNNLHNSGYNIKHIKEAVWFVVYKLYVESKYEFFKTKMFSRQYQWHAYEVLWKHFTKLLNF